MRYKIGDVVRLQDQPQYGIVKQRYTDRSYRIDFGDDIYRCFGESELSPCYLSVKDTYRVGDFVQIKGSDWYNERKDKSGLIECDSETFVPAMIPFLGRVFQIEAVETGFRNRPCYKLGGVARCYIFSGDMFEGACRSTQGNWLLTDKIEPFDMCKIGMSLNIKDIIDKRMALIKPYIHEYGRTTLLTGKGYILIGKSLKI